MRLAPVSDKPLAGMTNTAEVVGTAVVVATAIVVTFVAALVFVRSRATSNVTRGCCSAGVVLGLTLAPFLLDFLVMRLKRTDMFVSIDLGVIESWLPSAVGLAAALAVARAAKRSLPAN